MSEPKKGFSPYHPGGDDPTNISGLTPHVFEVTDLTILGGTDWSGAIGDENGPMLLGTLPFRAGQVVFHALQIEGSSTTTGVNVGLNVMESASIVNSVGVSSGASWAAFGAIVAAGTNSLNEADPATDVEWNIILRTDGPTSEDITINLARAAFLVL